MQMSSAITLSAGVRANLLSLQSTAALMTATQNRLATGKKVNSALDNPGNFFTSQSLSNRANDLNNLLDSIGQAQQTLKTADTAISSLTKLVESAKSIAKQAQQASAGAQVTTYSLTITGTVGSIAGTDTLDTYGVNDGDTITITDGTNTKSYTVGTASSETVQDLLDGLGGTGAGWTIGLDGNGNIAVSSTSNKNITVSGTGSLAGLGLVQGTFMPTATTTGTPSTTRANLQTQYNDLLGQIDALAKDASYNGVNLLNGDNLKVTFNEDGSSSLTISGVTFDSTGLGLSQLNGSEFQTNSGIDAVVTGLDAALSSLRSQASKFGSNLTTVQTRQDFTKNMINTLQTGADNLVLADTNEEGANLLALQTRQQLSTTALSLSAQADQAVLRLFG
jgi:flagellin